MKFILEHRLVLIMLLLLVLATTFIGVNPVFATQANVTTIRCTGFGEDWLLFNGNVTSYGGTVNITQVGFDYGVTSAVSSSNETTYSNYTIKSYGYYNYIDGLNSSTLYYFRANAYNGWWAYGETMQFSTAGTVVEWPWESNIGTVNTTVLVYGQNWAMQSFTVNDTAHTLTSVDLWLSRMNSPGDVTITIQRAGADGLPYGTILSTGVIPAQYTGNINPIAANTTARYNIPLSIPISLLPSTRYCVTVKALMGDYNNYLLVANRNTGTYGYGIGYSSVDNGLNWTNTGTDFLFDLWGKSCLQVDIGQVFSGYKQTDDWLFVFLCDNKYPPYYPDLPPNQYFAYQLVDEYNTVLAQSACENWGMAPGSLYLNPTVASVLTWQGDYRLRLVNIQNDDIYMEYALQTVDWKGTDLDLLDEWVFASANRISNYTGGVLTVDITGRGTVLNPVGSVMFVKGVPYLDTARPELFQVVVSPSEITTTATSQTMRQAYNWVTLMGPDFVGAMNASGAILGGISGQYIALVILILMFIGISGWAFMPGQTVAATTIGGGLLLSLSVITGILDMVWGGILLAISAFFIIYMLWLRSG